MSDPHAAPKAGNTIRQLNVFQLRIHSWNDVRRQLRHWLGGGVPDGNSKARSVMTTRVADNITTAVEWYRLHLGGEFHEHEEPLRRAFLELLGIDFHADVATITWPPQQPHMATYVCRRGLPRWLPAEDRALLRRDHASELPTRLGGFFTQLGVPPDRLGIHATDRQLVRVAPLQAIPALRTRASGIVDNWTDTDEPGMPGVWHTVGGGGVQHRIPKRIANDPDWLAILPPRQPW